MSNKKSHQQQDEIYQPTDIVLAKVKGYPAWPAMIIPTEIIPPNVLKSNSHIIEDDEGEQEIEQEENNYIIYSKILKFKKFNSLQEIYCVKFFKDDSYIWVKRDNLTKLSLQDCQDWLSQNESSGKHKRLIPAYEMACQGFKTNNGIDVWEFVEYGSKTKKLNPDDEEYTDDNSSLTPKNTSTSRTRGKRKQLAPETPSRISIRQRHLREQNEKENIDLEEPRVVKKRNTRSKITTTTTTNNNNNNNNNKSNKKVEEKNMKSETVQPPKKRGRKPAAAAAAVAKPVIEKYNYEDDENWTIVGMGPQNFDVTSKMSSLVTRLSQKKNLERHNETKLDLSDKILSINRLLFDILTGTPQKDDYEIILDEFEIALSINGPKNEFISIFRSNNELLANFRMLFNLKLQDLENFDLFDNFQQTFHSIYKCSFIPDLIPWSKDRTIEDGSENIDPQSETLVPINGKKE